MCEDIETLEVLPLLFHLCSYLPSLFLYFSHFHLFSLPSHVRESTLIIDEVDLVLHPLKSELNYPIGPKEPLDLARTKKEKGLRWQVPFHLIDALFFVTTGQIRIKHQQR